MSPLRLLSKNQPTNQQVSSSHFICRRGGNQAATYSTMAVKCFSISNTQILASAGHNNSSSSTSHSIPKTSPSLPKFNTTPTSSQSTSPQKLKHPKKKHKNPTQPSIAEIERAIGAGVFRDPAIYKRVESGSDIGGEWPVEKKLREVGEWLLAATETSPDTSSRNILKTVFLWILPMWVLAFLVAARIIQLPFTSPFLDDLLL
ncbi:probable NAD(P)H dehydrogenase subunit CRR3, chloroplastic [Ipomoea triloba]|uniref:probable NAD(P)H dehydrogenase subunit CRR3, chloroplastic n=1 Tax=Ipomoea triloba TaxID=35885 RepID=UPI00125DC947|nr:probable NAD(P)H dehydrogenase subunit CRR3, chloroplastic [Ipomoea triloba]